MIEAIQPFLAPAVMISAGGLLCLAQFGRYSAVMAQVRTLDRERMTIFENVNQADPQQREILFRRSDGLEQQAEKILAHTTIVRNALRLLVVGVLLMVLCSLTIGASLLYAPLGSVAVGVFVSGLIATFAGLCFVLVELGVSMESISFEHDNLNRLRRGKGFLQLEIPDLRCDDQEPENT